MALSFFGGATEAAASSSAGVFEGVASPRHPILLPIFPLFPFPAAFLRSKKLEWTSATFLDSLGQGPRVRGETRPNIKSRNALGGWAHRPAYVEHCRMRDWRRGRRGPKLNSSFCGYVRERDDKKEIFHCLNMQVLRKRAVPDKSLLADAAQRQV